jgi:hypothetical protein
MIKLELTIQEVEHALKFIGCGPYAEVADLVNKIREQGLKQVQEMQASKNVVELPQED